MQGNKRKDKYNNDYISYRYGCRKQKRYCKNREIKRDLLEEFILKELEDKVLSDDKIPFIAKELNNKLQNNKVENAELLQNISLKLDKTNKEIENILNAIMSGIMNDTLKNKLNKSENTKLNLELEMKELSRSTENDSKVNITEEQIKLIFSKFREFILEKNIPECKKFISQYVKEVLVYRDHVKVLFNVVFLLPESDVGYEYNVIKSRKFI